DAARSSNVLWFSPCAFFSSVFAGAGGAAAFFFRAGSSGFFAASESSRAAVEGAARKEGGGAARSPPEPCGKGGGAIGALCVLGRSFAASESSEPGPDATV